MSSLASVSSPDPPFTQFLPSLCSQCPCIWMPGKSLVEWPMCPSLSAPQRNRPKPPALSLLVILIVLWSREKTGSISPVLVCIVLRLPISCLDQTAGLGHFSICHCPITFFFFFLWALLLLLSHWNIHGSVTGAFIIVTALFLNVAPGHIMTYIQDMEVAPT